KERRRGHQHQADRAVAADVVLDAALERCVDDVAVHRIEDDHRVVFHAQRGGGVDPVALPAGLAQLWIELRRVVAALTRDQDVHLHELREVFRVLDGADAFTNRRPGCSGLRGREEHRFDRVEVVLLAHALHEDRPHHSAPPNEPYVHDGDQFTVLFSYAPYGLPTP